MPSKRRDLQADCARLHERAQRWRQMADGAGDQQFAVLLNALAREYDGKAELIDEYVNLPKQLVC
jgi:hypothetical protein